MQYNEYKMGLIYNLWIAVEIYVKSLILNFLSKGITWQFFYTSYYFYLKRLKKIFVIFSSKFSKLEKIEKYKIFLKLEIFLKNISFLKIMEF